MDARAFVESLAAVPFLKRDHAVAAYFGIAAPTHCGAPPGGHMVGYYPTGIATIARMALELSLHPGDVFIDIGSGLGKVVLLAHLFTGAEARGVEIQADLVTQARAAAERRRVSVRFTRADARVVNLDDGTVFFMYAPFTGPIMDAVLCRLRAEATRRAITVVTVSLDLAREAAWLTPRPELKNTGQARLAIYDSDVPGVSARVAGRMASNPLAATLCASLSRDRT